MYNHAVPVFKLADLVNLHIVSSTRLEQLGMHMAGYIHFTKLTQISHDVVLVWYIRESM